MFSLFFLNDSIKNKKTREGEVYRELNIDGKIFKILYGYYESFERNSKYNDPIPIYPDLIKDPVYTDEGIPIVTAMQDVCENFECKHDDDGDSCQDCSHFKNREDLFGVCTCEKNKITQ